MKTAEIWKKLRRIEDLSGNIDKPLNIFYIDSRSSFYLNNSHVYLNHSRIDFYSVRSANINRGDILNVFSEIEFIVNEILKNHYCGLGANEEFNLLLEQIDFGRKVYLLRNLKIINSSAEKSIKNVAFVRNQFAHIWKISEIEYLEKPITEKSNFSRFKKDLEEIFELLVSAIQIQFKKLNLEEYIDKLLLQYESAS